MREDIAQILRLEMTILGLVNMGQNSHDFTFAAVRRTAMAARANRQLLLRPKRGKRLPRIIDSTEQGS